VCYARRAARAADLQVGGGEAGRGAQGLAAGAGGLQPVVQGEGEDDVGELGLPARAGGSGGLRG
jgi:hypothetical protein